MNAAVIDKTLLQRSNQKTKSSTTGLASSLDEVLERPSLTMRRPNTDWNQNSVAHFFHNYVSAVQDVGHGYLEFLPTYYTRHRNCDASMQRESMKLYGRALKSVSTALMHPKAFKSDILLIAITLLQKHEVSPLLSFGS
ncbi:hypothetical protein EJ05DRAFT_471698 [Pseudovirgaria hyperparasitica]|uniref:Uncharacterized protein n=1 Tax=Pseudovirgaria hyperparasitica TaxID=470096 RepID=A0A6A6WKP9_9PEZI|nr:uncharacterized protein EJ05DRAFT_471698 [Pseudovirgaria hyperparasitica]KAF2762746.1 hypothetical protein EJ05DRAFT_471698 [Pseudovirgaria hyperparasitica]